LGGPLSELFRGAPPSQWRGYKGLKGEKSIKYLKIFFRTSDDSAMIFGVEH
jgi:hypothetical protein